MELNSSSSSTQDILANEGLTDGYDHLPLQNEIEEINNNFKYIDLHRSKFDVTLAFK